MTISTSCRLRSWRTELGDVSVQYWCYYVKRDIALGLSLFKHWDKDYLFSWLGAALLYKCQYDNKMMFPTIYFFPTRLYENVFSNKTNKTVKTWAVLDESIKVSRHGVLKGELLLSARARFPALFLALKVIKSIFCWKLLQYLFWLLGSFSSSRLLSQKQTSVSL